ncbi:MAG: methyltransferase domain-containing protein [bacterium]
MALDECLACGGGHLKEVADLGESPVLTGALFDDRATARAAACGQLLLGACVDCGHVQNLAFDPDRVEYDVTYDNSLHFSGTFQQYAEELAAHLVNDLGVRGKRVVEIGSGKGDFLRSITGLGGNTGTGYDPTVEPSTDIPGVRLVRDYFRPGDQAEPYDLLVCRHVLEHLDDPASLLRTLAVSAPPGALHYFEVPAAEFNFGPDGLWDCIYPHVSYFSRGSLAALIRRCGFEISDIRHAFHGQFIAVEARAGHDTAPVWRGGETILDLVERFAERHERAVRRWQAHVARLRAGGAFVAVWGAGSKGVNFLNAVDPTGHLPAVDINPRKRGRFLPLGGHQVIGPMDLVGRSPAQIIVTNPVYTDEIRRTVQGLGVATEIAVA